MDIALIFIVLSGVTLMMVFLAVVILTGHGDGLIAGYNTAKKEKREQYNMKRLRAVVAGLILFTMIFVWCVALIDNMMVTLLGLIILLVAYIASIYIANSWCKKK